MAQYSFVCYGITAGKKKRPYVYHSFSAEAPCAYQTLIKFLARSGVNVKTAFSARKFSKECCRSGRKRRRYRRLKHTVTRNHSSRFFVKNRLVHRMKHYTEKLFYRSVEKLGIAVKREQMCAF